MPSERESERRGYVLRISSPPKKREQLQVAAALLQSAAVVIVPHRCSSIEEWLARYGRKT